MPALKLYLRRTTDNSASGPSAEQSTAQPNGTVSSPTFAKRDLDVALGTVQDPETVVHTHPAESGVHRDGLMRMFVSAALAAVDIAAGDWRFGLSASQSNNAADTYNNVVVYVWRPGTGAKVGTIIDAHQGTSGPGGEVANENSVSTIAGSAVSGIQTGDRIVFEWWHHWQHSMSSAYTSTIRYDDGEELDDVTQTNHSSWIECPQDDIFGGAGPVEHFGASSLTVTAARIVAATRNRKAAAASSYTAGRVVTAKKVAKAAAAAVYTLGATVAGNIRVSGAASLSVTVARAVAAKKVANAATVTQLALGRTTAAAKNAKGASTLPVTVGRTVAATKNAKGSTVVPVVFSVSSAGVIAGMGASLAARIADWAGVGTTYYVDAATGSDSNSEAQAQSESTPWATIMKAVNTLVIPASGHVRILVKNGTYRAAGNSNAVQATVNFFSLGTRTPSADHVLIIENYPGHTPVVEEPTYTGASPTTAERHGFWFDDSSAKFIRIRGFEVRPNGASVALNQCQGFRIDGTTTDVEIDGCHIHGWNASGGGTDPRSQGIFVSSGAARVHVYNTIIEDIGDSTNEAANLSHGLYLGGSSHQVVNCLVYDNRNGFGVQFYEGGGGGSGHIVSHVVSANNKKSGMVVDGTFTVDVRNSSFYDNDEWAISARATANITARYNHTDANGFAGDLLDGYENEGTGTFTVSNKITGAPLFTDFATKDFTLATGSPLINAGDDAYTPTTDITGAARVNPDLGAYAFVPVISGASSLTLTFGSTTVGKKIAHGASARPLTVAVSTLSVRGAYGAATLPVTVTVAAAGRRGATAAASGDFSVTTTSAGKKVAYAATVAPFTVGITTRGLSVLLSLTPASTGSLTLGAATSGTLSLASAQPGDLTLPAAQEGALTLDGATDGSITLTPA